MEEETTAEDTSENITESDKETKEQKSNKIDNNIKKIRVKNNNFKIEDENNPFSEPKKVFNGQFGTITNVSNTITPEFVTPKGKHPITINFREVNIVLNDTGHNATILSLENYRLSEKGELSEDAMEEIALQHGQEFVGPPL